MDPTAPAQIVVWVVTGIMALFSLGLGGCGLRVNPGYGYSSYAPPPFYGAPPAQPAQPAYYQPRPITSCITIGNFVTCN